LRSIQYAVLSLQNGMLTQIGDNKISETRIVVFESGSGNPATVICDSQRIAKGGCQSPNPIDSAGFYSDDYSAGDTGPNTVKQVFFVDRGLVSVFWPQKASDNNVYWYGSLAYSQSAAVDRVNIPNGALIIQNNPDLQHGVSCFNGNCSFRQATGILLTP
jgi:hypothetical protein